MKLQQMSKGGRSIGCRENWACTPWKTCSIAGYQTRRCSDINECGTMKDKPEERRKCIYKPTCFDGIQNQDEEGIDCGGSCEKPCEEIKEEKINFIIIKSFSHK